MPAEQFMTFLPLIAVILFFYFGIMRPQKKKEKEIQAMRESIKVGDDILTIGGIVGKVVVVKEDMLTIETGAPKSRIELYKWGINSKIEK
ncbi:MAG: preprotein translocase subunit YajC [Tissierellia bacterium]|nr:preprotein translocase subunit YajC [Tissierellia bacterium]